MAFLAEIGALDKNRRLRGLALGGCCVVNGPSRVAGIKIAAGLYRAVGLVELPNAARFGLWKQREPATRERLGSRCMHVGGWLHARVGILMLCQVLVWFKGCLNWRLHQNSEA